MGVASSVLMDNLRKRTTTLVGVHDHAGQTKPGYPEAAVDVYDHFKVLGMLGCTLRDLLYVHFKVLGARGCTLGG
ncbi:hypothetical protein E2562_038687 [Oryza meyeriana var. granulata]|uniref:Uncharacterized protein n=1 Tax=Oryza meyeriana var. granulata TaxID=110450 RepID=A0A6G1CYB9_9ORYZ|nr:hypothetical protein E2562_038687 [Oryza meyeriana var. granulata]